MLTWSLISGGLGLVVGGALGYFRGYMVGYEHAEGFANIKRLITDHNEEVGQVVSRFSEEEIPTEPR